MYKIYNSKNADTHVIKISNHIMLIQFYVLDYWCLLFKYYSEANVKCLYLPMLYISINNNETHKS